MKNTNWDLARYFYNGLDDENFASDIAEILPKTQKFAEKYRETLPKIEEPEQILVFYHEYEALLDEITKPSYYLFYRSALDTQDTEIQKKQGEVDALFVEVGNLLLFISQAWKTIGKEKILAWADISALSRVKNDLVQTANMLQHILSEKEEYVLNAKSRALALANELQNNLTGSYEFTMTIDGEEKKLTEEEVRTHRQNADRTIRKQAYDSLRAIYNTRQNQITLGNIYTSIVKNWSSEIQIRGYANVLAQRNIGEQLDDAVVEMLLEEVRSAYPLYHRYLQKKASLLNISDFSIWDTSAPIGKMNTNYTFDEAFDLHLSVMKDFDEEFYDYSVAMREEGRIDVFPKMGKQGGAFASYRKNSESFVLLNFNGKLRDVSTLSHELGHAIHGHLSQAQEGAVYDSPLSLAETASIFSEMLLGEKIKNQISEDEYATYLDERLSDIFATIFRQVQYVSFEKEVHEAIHAGNELTYKELNLMYRNHQTALYGEKIVYDVEAKDESTWSMIPHIFHTPFYCYSYAFGNILVFSLYNKYRENPSFKEDYKNILRAGGSLPPATLLGQYGIDITSLEFYRAGIREIEKLVEEFEKMEGLG